MEVRLPPFCRVNVIVAVHPLVGEAVEIEHAVAALYCRHPVAFKVQMLVVAALSPVMVLVPVELP